MDVEDNSMSVLVDDGSICHVSLLSLTEVTTCAAFLNLMYDYEICSSTRTYKSLISSVAMQIEDSSYQQLP